MGPVYTPKAMLERLVAFDTTSRDSNLPLIDFVRDYLGAHGVDSVLVPDAKEPKASLFATIGGAEGGGGVALSGHTDVVPVDGQAWDTNPFSVVERDGRLYGRGTCDMKGFIAVALAMVPEFLARPLRVPIHFALSYDEEVGCTGVQGMIEAIGRNLPRPTAVIVGEPTRMEVVDAHKSIADYVTEVTGHEAHSSKIHSGANAILAAGELLGEISRLREEMIELGDPTGRFSPPCTSVHVGMIHGGTALNIIPRKCHFTWEIRALPGFEERVLVDRFESFARQTVLPKLRAVAPSTDILTEQHVGVAGLAPDPGSPAERLAMRLAGTNRTQTVSFATEGGLYQRKGIPAIVCGPGDIAQAHQPNEYLEIEQLEACVGFMRRLRDIAVNGL